MTRPRGRPPLTVDQRRDVMSTRLPPAVYDELCRIASRQGVSVSRVLRYAAVRLVRLQKDERGGAVRL